GLPIEEDPDALPELLIYRVVAPPRTLFKNVRTMPFAGELTIQLKDGNWRIDEQKVGYQPPVAAAGRSETVMVEEIAGSLNDLVSTLNPVASSVATLLSGGIDSSTLSAIARDRISVYDTYSTSYPFDDVAVNLEQKYALSAACALSTRHTLFAPAPSDFITGFVEALGFAEAPLNHLQSVLLHLVFKRSIPARIDRILCGAGADAAFGMADLCMWCNPPDLRRRFFSLPPVHLGLGLLGRGWARAQKASDGIAQTKRLNLPVSDPYSPIWESEAYGNFAWVRAHYGASRDDVTSYRRESLGGFADRSFQDAFAVYVFNYAGAGSEVWSKLAEAQGKILFCPFSGKRVLDAAFSIPWKTKLKAPKYIVRRVAEKLGVPQVILNRPKQSFGIVSDRWAEPGGVLEPLVAVAAKVVDIKQLRDLQGNDSQKAMMLWSLLNYAVLKRLFVQGESAESLLSEVLDNCGQKARSAQAGVV
ncbi:MAG: asparagine synthase-related protein, partial [Terriglobales bacterium]